MKKLWILLLMSLAGLHLVAQNIVYPSLKAYLAQDGDTIVALKVEKRTKNQIVLTGGADYKLSVEDNEVACKYLKGRCFLASVDSALYINCKRLRYKKLRFGGWYAPATQVRGNLYFSAMPLGTAVAGSSVTMNVTLGGSLGDALASSGLVTKRVYYEIDTTTGKITFVGKEKMELLLAGHPEWKEAYLKEDSESATVTGQYLEKLKRAQ